MILDTPLPAKAFYPCGGMLLVMESDNLAVFPSEQEQLCSLVEEGCVVFSIIN